MDHKISRAFRLLPSATHASTVRVQCFMSAVPSWTRVQCRSVTALTFAETMEKGCEVPPAALAGLNLGNHRQAADLHNGGGEARSQGAVLDKSPVQASDSFDICWSHGKGVRGATGSTRRFPSVQ